MFNRTSLYEQKQRQWTLGVIIWILLATSILLTIFNLRFDSPLSIISLSTLNVLCIVALILNHRGSYTLAAVIISIMVLVALTANVYEGDGLFDPGVAGFFLFIVFGTLLFGKRSVLLFMLSALLPLLLIAFLQSRGLIDVTIRDNDTSNLIPDVIFVVVSSLVVWIITTNTERDLVRIRQDESDLRKAYEMTLSGWAKALEYRDKETEGHSQRVVSLSQRLAQALGCTEEDVQTIRWGAILHDIGKMGVPDHILLKPDTLDPQETEIMHLHPQYGMDMLTGISFLQPALAIIYSHHERWDGTGYPQGLKGEEIPLSARIFAVIDNWDALNSDRPYRKAWQPEQVVDYIRANAGTMFDPDIVKVFLAMDYS